MTLSHPISTRRSLPSHLNRFYFTFPSPSQYHLNTINKRKKYHPPSYLSDGKPKRFSASCTTNPGSQRTLRRIAYSQSSLTCNLKTSRCCGGCCPCMCVRARVVISSMYTLNASVVRLSEFEGALAGVAQTGGRCVRARVPISSAHCLLMIVRGRDSSNSGRFPCGQRLWYLPKQGSRGLSGYENLTETRNKNKKRFEHELACVAAFQPTGSTLAIFCPDSRFARPGPRRDLNKGTRPDTVNARRAVARQGITVCFSQDASACLQVVPSISGSA